MRKPPKSGRKPAWMIEVNAYYQARAMERQYGMYPNQFSDMLKAQGGACAICGKPQDKQTGKGLVVDHDHATGNVRGLLCNACNGGLGQFKDSTDLLMTATRYLWEAGT